MSRHRVKTLGYDGDDFEDEDYDDVDPEEQEQLEAYTNEVLNALRTGQPSVTASRQEVQEALWHYYNDVEKCVNYLRGMSSSLYYCPKLLLALVTNDGSVQVRRQKRSVRRKHRPQRSRRLQRVR